MNFELLEKIKGEIDRIMPEIIDIRHTIHQNPEIACKEYETAELIRKNLKKNGIQALKPFLETDVVAILEGKNKEGKNATLRADIDALPIQEKTNLPYTSKRDGYMHACGHDGHAAMLIGASLILHKFRDQFNGSVRFVFQPGEEIVAAGRWLIEKGALIDPEPDIVVAMHGCCDLPEGVIASKPGVLMAAADFFKIRIKGKGAHGSRPEISIDPILTATRVVEALQSLVSHSISVLEPVVLSVCRICGGSNSNIIPDNVDIEGTVRYFKPGLGENINTEMERIVKGVCDSMGASYELSYSSPYIPTINNPEIVKMGKKITHEVIGPANWTELDKPFMGAEDFSYYLVDYPGAMFRIGMGNGVAPLHNARFDFNDNAMKNGILFLVSMALAALR